MLLSASSLAALLFLKTNQQVTNISLAPQLPADLAHATPDLGVHQDDEERHEDEVGVAEDVLQEQQLEPAQMIQTSENNQENALYICLNLKITPSAR